MSKILHPTPPRPPSMSQGRSQAKRTLPIKKILLIGGPLFAVVVVAALWWLFYGGEEPAEVDLSTAVAEFATATVAEESAPAGGSAAAGGGGGGPSESVDDPVTSTSTAATSEGTGAVEGSAGGGGSESPELAANPVTVTSATAPGGGSDGGGGGGPSEPVVNPVAAAADPIAGTWTIYEGVAGSFAGFQVDGDVTVVGRTEGVSGFIRISAGRLEATEVTVDMSGIEAYRPMRGRLIHRALATDRFPTSTFVQTESVALPANAADGVAFSLKAKGDMTIKGITNPVVFALEVQLTDNGIVIVGSAGVRYDDFGVRAPSVPIAVSIKDHGTVEFQLLFTR